MSIDDLHVTAYGARIGGRFLPCAIGRGGIKPTKVEGDGVTPAGVHEIVGLLYRPDRIAKSALPAWAQPIRPNDLWSDDIRDPHYNQLVRGPHEFSHESLRRADPLYDLILVTDWNWPHAVAGMGSAIFIHRWRRPRYPTAGCVAFDPQDLLWLANRLQPRSKLVIQG